MSHFFPQALVAEVGVALFTAAGAQCDEARIAIDALVVSSLMGHDSHGVIRIPEYLGYLEKGLFVPGAPVTIERTGPGTAVVDCGFGFGAVGAERAIREGIAIAKEQRTASIITRRCNHVGRLGAWVQLAADHGMLAIATCNSPPYSHFVLPWGGRESRLATNPIAWAAPTNGDPIVADFATSVAAEGKVRLCRNEGRPVPNGWILDSTGNPSNNADDFYGPPRGGILPLGGSAGYKGFALGLLVEVLGNALAGRSCQDPDGFGNGVCFIVIDPMAFVPLSVFRQLMNETIAYMKSSPPVPGVEEVLVPGELEFRTLRKRRELGIPIDDATLQSMQEKGQRLGVDVAAILGAGRAA
jgi:uncharacterized oxidoreductase